MNTSMQLIEQETRAMAHSGESESLTAVTSKVTLLNHSSRSQRLKHRYIYGERLLSYQPFAYVYRNKYGFASKDACS